jgi:Skp family chaperone for outer membrane proteins
MPSFMRSLIFALVVGGLSFAARSVVAEELPKVATVNPQKVFDTMQETQEKKKAQNAEVKDLQAQEDQQLNEIKEMQKQRDATMRKGAPEYTSRTNEIMDKTIKLRVWHEVKNQELGRRHKEEVKALFDKIQTAVAQIAQERKIELVIADYAIDIPEDLDQVQPDQLNALLRQRQVMYAGKGVDITAEVIARLDAAYSKK